MKSNGQPTKNNKSLNLGRPPGDIINPKSEARVAGTIIILCIILVYFID